MADAITSTPNLSYLMKTEKTDFLVKMATGKLDLSYTMAAYNQLTPAEHKELAAHGKELCEKEGGNWAPYEKPLAPDLTGGCTPSKWDILKAIPQVIGTH